jgi:hypothetical protein
MSPFPSAFALSKRSALSALVFRIASVPSPRSKAEVKQQESSSKAAVKGGYDFVQSLQIEWFWAPLSAMITRLLLLRLNY